MYDQGIAFAHNLFPARNLYTLPSFVHHVYRVPIIAKHYSRHCFLSLWTLPQGAPAQGNRLPSSGTLCLWPSRQPSWGVFPGFPTLRCSIYFCLPPPAEVIPEHGSGLETDYSDPGALPSPP